MFANAYLDTAAFLLNHYNGAEPFHLYLKTFFAAHKKYGARDRKYIAQLCYSWFRAGHALKHLGEKEQLQYALFLCSEAPNPLLQSWSETLFTEGTKPLAEKLALVQERVGFSVAQLFPWSDAVSQEIEAPLFNQSLLVQPHLFLRIRPGRESRVIAALERNGIPFEKAGDHCLALNNSTKVETMLNIDQDVVVQDRNSQRVLELLQAHGHLKKFAAWDCCAASGGKSLLLLDSFSNAHTTVSDVRESILHNLRKRFQKAGITHYDWFVGNAATGAPPHRRRFNVILCDVPCSGSGTWGRTPEQLHFYDGAKTAGYAQLQKAIVANANRYLEPGGWLLYSTCSVFAAENEAVVQQIAETGKLKFFKSTYYKGYTQRADTLFAALFQAL